jgi:hypothetical protein
MRRWSCPAGPDGCVPAPLETAAVEVEIPASDMRILAPEDGSALALVSGVDGDLELRRFDPEGVPDAEADAVAAGAVGLGATLADACAGADGEVLALVTEPVSGAPGCRTVLFAYPPSGEPREVASWSPDGLLGCRASLAVLTASRYVVAWRGPASTAGTVRIDWTLGTLVPGF